MGRENAAPSPPLPTPSAASPPGPGNPQQHAHGQGHPLYPQEGYCLLAMSQTWTLGEGRPVQRHIAVGG